MQVNAILSTKDTTTEQSILNTKEQSDDFSTILDSQKESSTLEDIFKEASETYGVSVSLLEAVAKQESGFNANATSRCGAQGIMQLMPATAAGLGVTDAYDAKQNIMGGAKYLSQLLNSYNGDVTLALAAYNAGGNNVAKYGGVPPFAETQNYVAKVTGYMQSGVTLPDGTVTVGSSYATNSSNDPMVSSLDVADDGSNISEVLDKLFSYDDYLKFIDMFMNDYTDQAIESFTSYQNNEEQQDDNSSNYYAYQNINMNSSIFNLLNNNSTI